MYQIARRNSNKHSISWPFKTLVLLVLFGAILTVLEITGVTHFFNKKGLPSHFPVTTTTDGASAYVSKGRTNTSGTSSTKNSSAVPPATDTPKLDATSTTSAILVSPSGDFVSNHNPGKNGTPESENSVCNTTPGAKCQIVFTNNSTNISLPAQTTDIDGATYWNGWTPASIGLTTGTWQIKAIATLNNQTKTAIDPMNLVVQ